MRKRCTKCHEVKPRSEFYRDGKRRDGIAPQCKACGLVYQRSWRGRNRERERAQSRKWRAGNSDKVRGYYAAYQGRHPQKLREASRRWRVANPEAERRVRARTFGVALDLTDAQWEVVLLIHCGSCHYCGSPDGTTQDHIVPLSRGGPHIASNVAPACMSCNTKKQDKTPAQAFGGA